MAEDNHREEKHVDDDITKVVSVLDEQPELVRELVLNSTRDWKHDLTSMSYTVVLDQASRAKPKDQTGRGVSDSNKDVFICCCVAIALCTTGWLFYGIMIAQSASASGRQS